PHLGRAALEELYGTHPYMDAYRRHMDMAVEHDPRLAPGGLWEELGQLQIGFLRLRGLLPSHSLLDIGCSTLRAGRLLISYLLPKRYTGFDMSPAAIRAARDLVTTEGLADKEPHLFVTEGSLTFIELAGQRFDFVLAQSVFTHLPDPTIVECFANIGRILA